MATRYVSVKDIADTRLRAQARRLWSNGGQAWAKAHPKQAEAVKAKLRQLYAERAEEQIAKYEGEWWKR
jgi:hypothetical protein